MAAQEGGCLCGGIRFAVKAPPLRVTICHCRFCQRATGSAFLVEPIFAKADFSVTTGQPALYRQASAGSGKTVEINFCKTCGTKLYLAFERFPDIVGIYGGTFDDPNWIEITPDNTRHIFLSVAWRGSVIPKDTACYEQHAITSNGAPVESRVFREHQLIGARG